MDMISRRGIHGSVVDGEDMKYAIFFFGFGSSCSFA